MSWDDDSQLSSSDDGSDAGNIELHDACEAGALDLVQQILADAQNEESEESEPEDGDVADKPKRRVDINKRDRLGCTPLHVAILWGQDACVKALLEAGAEISFTCNNSSALHLAVCTASFPHLREASIRTLDLLLEHDGDVRSRDDLGRTPLHWAAVYGVTPAVTRLIEAAASNTADELQELKEEAGGVGSPVEQLPIVAMQDSQRDTALHLAARHRQPSALEALLAAEGGHTAALLPNRLGLLPLHTAAKYGDLESARLLIAVTPADAKARGQVTAAEIARRRGHHAIAELLDPNGTLPPAPSTDPITPGTTIIAPHECWLHQTCPHPITRSSTGVPVENVNRLKVLTQEGEGILRTNEFAELRWQESVSAVAMSDVLRVHEWSYVKDLQATCALLEASGQDIGNLDGDTALSHSSYAASLKAAGAACRAVDEVVTGHSRNVFCAIRPPGHHAGPLGPVNSEKDPHGSHGFCLLNNSAIAAAYAMNRWRNEIKRVAILDFDVHHGNGTQACVCCTVPSHRTFQFSTPMITGSTTHPTWHPWYDSTDKENIFFASVQGYGRKHPAVDVYVYPGSGATSDTLQLKQMKEKSAADAAAAAKVEQKVAWGGENTGSQGTSGEHTMETDEREGAKGESAKEEGADGVRPLVPEDPNNEFLYSGGEHPPVDGPRIINVGIPGPGLQVQFWRRAWRDKILPAVVNFKPDLIVLSAGFDAHMKDSINYCYIKVQEPDFEWLTEQIVRVANTTCQGRIISLLEGGYEIDGGIVSAFARSVAAHVRALMDPHTQQWDEDEVEAERVFERAAAIERAQAAARAAKERKSGEDPLTSIAQRRKKRRTTTTVDYAQLNAEFEAASAAAKAAGTATAPGAGGSEPANEDTTMEAA